MAGRNKTFLNGPHFGDMESTQGSQHAANHARASGIDPRVGTVHKHGQGTVPVHGGMHTKTKAGHLAFAGGDMKSAVESGSVGPNPLTSKLAPLPKVFSDPPAVIGQRSRTNEAMASPGVNIARTRSPDHMAGLHALGHAILNQATKSGSTEIK
jgi:hypothetical protein